MYLSVEEFDYLSPGKMGHIVKSSATTAPTAHMSACKSNCQSEDKYENIARVLCTLCSNPMNPFISNLSSAHQTP